MSAASLDVWGIELSSQELHDRTLLAGLPIDLPIAAGVTCTWQADLLRRTAAQLGLHSGCPLHPGLGV